MARINNLASALGLEEDSIYDENAEPVSEADGVEASAEVDEAVNEVETATDTAANLVDDSTTLANVGDVVQDSIDSGEGISEPTAEVIQETIENILRRNGLSRNRRFRNMVDYPTNENYNDRRGRLNAARRLKVSIEGVWESVVDGLKALWKKIKDFFNKVFTAWGNYDEKYRKIYEDKLKEISHSNGLHFKEYTGNQTKANKSLKDANLGANPLPHYFYSTKEQVDLSEIVQEVENYIPKIKQAAKDGFNIIEENDADYQRFRNDGTSYDEKTKKAYNKATIGDEFNNTLNQILENAVCKLNKNYINVKNRNYSKVDVNEAGKCEYISQLTDDDWDAYKEAFKTGIKLCNQGISSILEKESGNFLTRIWDKITSIFSGAKKAVDFGSEVAGNLKSDEGDSDRIEFNTETEHMRNNMNTGKVLLGRISTYYKEVVEGYYDILSGIWTKQGETKSEARSR